MYLLSLFLRSCRAVRALATWWLSAHLGHRAGCRPPSRPQTPPDMSSRTKASLPSRLTRSKLEFTITKAKAPLVQSPPSTQQRKVLFRLYSKYSLLTLFLHVYLFKKILKHMWCHMYILNPSISKEFLDTEVIKKSVKFL